MFGPIKKARRSEPRNEKASNYAGFKLFATYAYATKALMKLCASTFCLH
jgi:hypothetical protein